MTAYRLIFHKDAEKGLKSLKSNAALTRRLVQFFDQLAIDPYSVSAKKLLGEWEGCFCYKAGPVRVIYEIRKEELIIYILEVGSRGDIY